MSSSLTYHHLPQKIALWPGLPLSLNGDEVRPLDDRTGEAGWLLYGDSLDKERLAHFQRQLAQPLVIVSAWQVEAYQVVRLAGSLNRQMAQLAQQQGLDVVPLHLLPSLQAPGLLVMDMDSTAIQIECIDEIAKLAGVGAQVAAITERAMQGELDFAASLRQRVASLKGADAAILQQVRDRLPLMPGLSRLVSQLQAHQWYVAIASGGFTYYADYLQEQLQLTAAVANQLEVRDGYLTGELLGPIVDAQYKAKTLQQLAQQYGIPPAQTIAIGDGANDLNMIKAAGLGIAFHAKPTVYQQANVAICHADLTGVLCMLSSSQKSE